MSTASALAVAAVLAGALMQSATGFGYAIVAAPVLAATAGPETAAPTLALTGALANLLLLGGERRPREVLWGQVARLTAWSLPGMAAGAAILAHASGDLLRALVAGAVLVAVGVHAWRARRQAGQRRGPASAGSTAGAGALSGVLSTTTGLNGPPLVLHLLGRATPGQTRDTLAAIFFAASALSIVAFAVSGTLDTAPDLAALIVATVAGWALGRRAFRALDGHHEAASLAILAFGAAVALVLGVQAIG